MLLVATFKLNYVSISCHVVCMLNKKDEPKWKLLRVEQNKNKSKFKQIINLHNKTLVSSNVLNHTNNDLEIKACWN